MGSKGTCGKYMTREMVVIASLVREIMLAGEVTTMQSGGLHTQENNDNNEGLTQPA